MPVEIGCEYLTVWGDPATIMGRVPGPGPELVWSAQGNHYHASTGAAVYGRNALVVMADPAHERAYWRSRLAEIEAANSADKLTLVAPALARMRQRLAELHPAGHCGTPGCDTCGYRADLSGAAPLALGRLQ